jgi:uncharacterized coiled-coil protein SlyX
MRQIAEIQVDIDRLRKQIAQVNDRGQKAKQQAGEFEAVRRERVVTALLDDPGAAIGADRAKATDMFHEAVDCDAALSSAGQRLSALGLELAAAEKDARIEDVRDLIVARRDIGKRIKSQAEALLGTVAEGKSLDQQILQALAAIGPGEAQRRAAAALHSRGAAAHALDCLAGRISGEEVLGGHDVPSPYRGLPPSGGALDQGDLNRVGAFLDSVQQENTAARKSAA